MTSVRAVGPAATSLAERTASRPEPGPPESPPAEGAAPPALLTLDRCLVAASVLVALVTGAVNRGGFPVYTEDEGVYTMQAWSVLHGRLSPYPYWYDHPFLGSVLIAPFLALGRLLAPQAGAVADARLATLVALAVDAGLMCVIARRVGMGRCAGVLAVALFLLSPLSQHELRRVFLDNVSLPWILAAVALALSARSRDARPALAGGCLGVAVLCKETSLLLAPVVVVALLTQLHRGERRRALWTATWSVLGIASLYPLYALLRGQLLPSPGSASLAKALKWQLVDRVGSGSVFDPGSQRNHTVAQWLSRDRELIVAGVVAAVILLAVRRLRPVAVAVLVPALWVLRPGGYLPAMFVIVALPFLALSAAAVGELLIGLLSRAGHRVAGGDAIRTRATAGWLSVTLLAATLPAQQRLHASDVLVAQGNRSPAEAVAWIRQNLSPAQRLLVDDVMWIELATVGWSDPWNQAVWFYKVDTSPDARVHLQHGWRDIDYVVSTRILRQGTGNLPYLVTARKALEHSVLVATFGHGLDRIELRRVMR